MSARTLTLGYSSCPNDVFIFEPLVRGWIDTGDLRFEPVIEDVEALNRRARRCDLDVTKISFHAFGHLRASHVLLDAGAALGRGCGPLVIARRPLRRAELPGCRIAVPGALTTAALLLRLHAPACGELEVMVFDEIVSAVAAARVDAGVIIHESRFTYAEHGLVEVVDLGEWWEEETGLPIPLGGIIADRRLGGDLVREIERRLRDSVQYAHTHPERIWPALRRHAREVDDDVIRRHIELYVTDFTEALGEEGHRAVEALLERAGAAGIVPERGSERDQPRPL